MSAAVQGIFAGWQEFERIKLSSAKCWEEHAGTEPPGVSVVAIEGSGHVVGVRLADGEVIPAAAVIAGIRIASAVEPLMGENGSLR